MSDDKMQEAGMALARGDFTNAMRLFEELREEMPENVQVF